LGGATVPNGGQILRGGAGGVVVKSPITPGKGQQPIVRPRGNRVGLV
jgi:hypothetical protein